jgi:uncharacterized membrane protein
VTGVWITIPALAVATAALKLAGPLLLGGRPLPSRAMSVIELLASALLAALVVVETFGHNRSLTIDARAAGVAVAAAMMARRLPMTVAVVAAAVVAAGVRALF